MSPVSSLSETAITGRELYAAALDIAGIRLKSGGIPATADDLSARSVSLINILIAENSFLNGLLAPGAAAPVLISSLDDTVSLDAKLLGSALPYGLCALLMLPDDPDEAALLHNRYVQAIVRIKSELPAKRQDITEVYGRT